MNWYNYLFAALALVGIIGSLGLGMPNYASRQNLSGVISSIALAAGWFGLFYWNVFA